MNKSAKGRRNEHKSRDLLVEAGYHFVIRSTGSFGPWDLVALEPGHPVCLVQVKSNRKPPALGDSANYLYDPAWLLRYHVWVDYAKLPRVYDARSGKLLEHNNPRLRTP